MRRWLSLGLLVTFSWLGGLVQDARGGITVDVVFQDATTPTGITIHTSVASEMTGPGCGFGGYAGGSVTTGYCMDVLLSTTEDFVAVSASVTYDSDNGLAIGAMYEWKAMMPSGWDIPPSMWCRPTGGLTDNGGEINSFDCMIEPPAYPLQIDAGTYRLGTIVWDTSGATPGAETIAAYINPLFDSISVIINGNVHIVEWPEIVQNSQILRIVPEPGTVALLGLGLAGLVLAARRCRPPTR